MPAGEQRRQARRRYPNPLPPESRHRRLDAMCCGVRAAPAISAQVVLAVLSGPRNLVARRAATRRAAAVRRLARRRASAGRAPRRHMCHEDRRAPVAVSCRAPRGLAAHEILMAPSRGRVQAGAVRARTVRRSPLRSPRSAARRKSAPALLDLRRHRGAMVADRHRASRNRTTHAARRGRGRAIASLARGTPMSMWVFGHAYVWIFGHEHIWVFGHGYI